MTSHTCQDDCAIRGTSEAEYRLLNSAMDALAGTSVRTAWIEENIIRNYGYVAVPNSFWQCVPTKHDLGRTVFLENDYLLTMSRSSVSNTLVRQVGIVTAISKAGVYMVIHIGGEIRI